MRILLVSPYAWDIPGGVNNHIANLSRKLCDFGNDVVIASPFSSEKNEGEAVCIGRSVAVKANDSIGNICLNISCIKKLDRLLSDGFDIVHVHEPYVPLVSLTVINKCECPLIVTHHAHREGGLFLYKAFSPLIKRIQKRITCRIAVSPAARETAYMAVPENYIIIPNGVDTGFFHPCERKDLFEKPFTILFVGRPEPRKGLEIMIRAFDKVCEISDDIDLVVIGSEKKDSALESNYDFRIKWVGKCTGEELANQYRKATVYCSPALGGESFGITLAEAMASGTPIIASDISGYRWTTDNGKAGVLVEPGDVNGMAEALVGLVNDHMKRQHLSLNGLQRAKDFSWDSVADRIQGVYMKAIEESS